MVFVCLAALIGACGAEGYDAPATLSADDCGPLDETIEGLLDLVDRGRLQTLKSVMAEGLEIDERHDLMAIIIDLIVSLPSGTFASLADMGAAASASESLQEVAAAAVRVLARDGSGAARVGAFAAARTLLNTCDGNDLVGIATAVLEDEGFIAAWRQLLVTGVLTELLAEMQFDTRSAGDAFGALVRNLLVTAADPGFEPSMWTSMAALVVDVSEPPWRDLTEGLERVLESDAARHAMGQLAGCSLASDPDLQLAAVVYDMGVDPVMVQLAEVLEDVGAHAVADPNGADIVLDPLRLLMQFLADHEDARASLVTVLTALLQDELGAGVLEDVADLLEAHVVGEVLDLFATLATGACPS